MLVSDKHHCVISDFGQSEMKSEAYRISGPPLPRMYSSRRCWLTDNADVDCGYIQTVLYDGSRQSSCPV